VYCLLSREVVMRKVGILGLMLAIAATVVVAIPAAATAASSTVGLVDTGSGKWYLRDAAGGTTSFYFGTPGDAPFVGDWDCDGIDTPGLYRQSDGYVYLRNSNSFGVADVSYFFGNPGDKPFAGDFNGDGCDTVSLFRPSEGGVYVINRLGSGDGNLGAADTFYLFGSPDGEPLAADFDGDGLAEIGLYDRARAVIRYLDELGSTVSFPFGVPGDQAIASTSVPGLAAFRSSTATFHLPGTTFAYGNGSLAAVAGSFGELPGGSEGPPALPTTALGSGSSGPAVVVLQNLLTARAFYRGAINGLYDRKTEQAVMAFHKDQWLPRSFSWQAADWQRLAAYSGPSITARPDEPFRVEIDIARQVGYLVENHSVTAMFPVSSGNGATFSGRNGSLAVARTPRGDFKIQRHINGLRISYLGALYKPWYFTGGYALHGSPSVPGYPASHGCVRMPNWDADWMDGHLFVGMPMHVH
jgi:lipoprotein-anchoring transpeptidase ErfK/SrfK